MYPPLDQINQVRAVFPGCDFSEKPLRYATFDAEDLEWVRAWAWYFYDGVPDFASDDFRIEGISGDFITVVASELFGPMPNVIWTRGRRWRRVASYTSSGEATCPWADVDPDDVPDAVRLAEACPVCGATASHREGIPGENHGQVYLGEGWAEVVYRSRS